MKLRIYTIILFLCTLSIHSTVMANVSILKLEKSSFSKNLDSLMKLSFIKENKDNTSLKSSSNNSFPKFSNEEYKSKFQQLNTIIELSYNEKVNEFIEFYTIQKRTQVEIMLALAEHYFPMFEKKLTDNMLPQELKYLPVALSALYPNAVSESGASGMWQLMYSTARIYRLKIDSYVDERRVPGKATDTAVKYLKDMYSIYSDWTLAIAAFTSGPANVNKAISRSGGKRSYSDIYEYLPAESRDYIYAYMAVVYLMNYHADHELFPINITIPTEFDQVEVKQKLHLGQVADLLDIPLQNLRDINLKYKREIIHPSANPEYLNLPVGYAEKFKELQSTIYAYKDSLFFQPKPVIVIPPKVSKSKVSYSSYNYSYTPPSVKNKTKITYKVKSGDSVGLIAQWFNINSSDLRYWNNIHRNKIIVGEELTVYVPKNKAVSCQKINSMTYEQKQRSVGKSTTVSKPKNTNKPADNNYLYYKVRRGDNLWTIARRYPGISYEDIIRVNNFPKKYTLYPGQYIKIKRK